MFGLGTTELILILASRSVIPSPLGDVREGL